MTEHEYIITIHIRGSELDADALTNAVYEFIYSDENKTNIGTLQNIELNVCDDCENDPTRLEPKEYPWEFEEEKK